MLGEIGPQAMESAKGGDQLDRENQPRRGAGERRAQAPHRRCILYQSSNQVGGRNHFDRL